jgi:hypothetical protein
MKDSTLLDRVLDGGPVPDAALDPEVERLIVLARALAQEAEAAPLHMRDEARSALRESLLRAAAERRDAPPLLLARLRERLTATGERVAHSARAATAGGVAAAVLSGGGVAVAADAALPGDLFYGLKLAVEDVVLAFDDPGASRGDALLSRAVQRIEEASEALRADDAAAAAAALRLADEATRDGAQQLLTAYLDGADTSVLEDLEGWVVTTRRRLDLLPTAVGVAGDALQDLRTTLDRIGQRVEVLSTGACTSCPPGVHDQPVQRPASARGAELDGTPPLPPAAPVDLSVIPPADEPFQPCPCVPASQPLPARPAPGPGPAADPRPDRPPPPPGEGDSPGGEGSGGSGEEPDQGPGGDQGPLPDTGPVTDALPEPVTEPLEDVIDALPDPDLPLPPGPEIS